MEEWRPHSLEQGLWGFPGSTAQHSESMPSWLSWAVSSVSFDCLSEKRGQCLHPSPQLGIWGMAYKVLSAVAFWEPLSSSPGASASLVYNQELLRVSNTHRSSLAEIQEGLWLSNLTPAPFPHRSPGTARALTAGTVSSALPLAQFMEYFCSPSVAWRGSTSFYF